MRRILVFGASGYVGSKLINTNTNTEVELIPVVRSSTGRGDEIVFDLSSSSPEDLPSDVDGVFYLAQSSQYRNFPEGSSDMLNVNGLAVNTLLEWCRKNNIDKFIFASTANVYETVDRPIDDTVAVNPGSYYGFSKSVGERACEFYREFIDITVLRFFTIFGPDQKGMLVPNIIDSVKRSREITLNKGIGLYLSPIYIDNVLEVLHGLIESESNPDVINVCGPEVISLKQIIEQIESSTGEKACIKELDREPIYLCSEDNQAVKKLIQGNEFVGFQEGLKRILSND